MKLPPFTVRRLMVVVAVAGIGLAAGMAGAFTFAVVTLSSTIILALLARWPGRAFFLGCSLFGWASMLLVFGAGPDVRFALPTTRPILRIYEAMSGPVPTAFKSPEEASIWISKMALGVNLAISVGHSLISLTFAWAGGISFWLIAKLWRSWAGRTSDQNPPEPKIAESSEL